MRSRPLAAAQDPAEPVGEGAAEQSCRTLVGGTAGLPDQVPAEVGGELPQSWPEAPAGLLPEHVYLRTETETFNRLYEFALRDGTIYGRTRDGAEPWRELPIPLCFAGRVASISLDDDEMVALDTANRVYTMDGALKGPSRVQLDEPLGDAVLDRAGLRAAGRRARLVVVGGLAARGPDLDRPGRQPDRDRRRQGQPHLGPARGRAAADVLGPVAARSTRATRCAGRTAAASAR